jgi:hypothetical protein
VQSVRLSRPGRFARHGVRIEWTGDGGDHLRLAIDTVSGQPVIADFAIQRSAGNWATILHSASPTFSVTTGLRRISGQQLLPLKGLKVPITQAEIDKYRWDPFWDAPLDLSSLVGRNPPPVEGILGTDQPGLPRSPLEIERADVRFQITGCVVRTDGARIVVVLPGVTLGAFTGQLQYTIFRGTNLVRQEVVASTAKPWVAYKFSAGVSGITRSADTQIRWRDTSNQWQTTRLGGAINRDAVPLVASHRLVTVEKGDAALSLFPEPHRFFWSREVSINMGYNWYRKDGDAYFSVGIRHNDREDESESSANWALYSARPGTEQRMPVYLYPTLGKAEANVEAALAFTHGDRYKPLLGYQVMNHHYHMDLGERLIAAGSVDTKLPDLVALKALGINIVSQIDSVLFRGDPGADGGDRPGAGATGRATAAPALARRSREHADPLKVTASAVAGARAHSDSDFLVMANQEIFDSPLGGHTDILFSHPVYWDRRKADQQFESSDPRYGKVYHIGDAADFMTMVRNENVLISMPHPRTKGSTGFPDAVKDTPVFRDSHYDGVGMRWGMGLDGSERRLCEYRCWPLLDDMSNWMSRQSGPLKHILSISEVRHMQPGDDIYSSQPVTYLKLDTLPTVDDTSSVIRALSAGDSFWTTGEVLATNFTLHYAGAKSLVEADVEWTFPLEFVEVIWGDGKATKRKIVSTTDLPPNSRQHFKIPVDLRGAAWARFAAWDNASNGAVLQPVRVTGR